MVFSGGVRAHFVKPRGSDGGKR